MCFLGLVRKRLQATPNDDSAEQERKLLLPRFAAVGLLATFFLALEAVMLTQFLEGKPAEKDVEINVLSSWMLGLGFLIPISLFTPIICTLWRGHFPARLCEGCMGLLLAGLCATDMRYIFLTLGTPPLLTTWPLAVVVLDILLGVQSSPGVLRAAHCATHLWILARCALLIFASDADFGLPMRVLGFINITMVSCGAVMLDHRYTSRFAAGQRDLHRELTKTLELSGTVSALLAQLELDEAESVLDVAARIRRPTSTAWEHGSPRATELSDRQHALSYQELVSDLRTIVVHLKVVAPFLPDMITTWRRTRRGRSRDVSPQWPVETSVTDTSVSVVMSRSSSHCFLPPPPVGNLPTAVHRASGEEGVEPPGHELFDAPGLLAPGVLLPHRSSTRTLKHIVLDRISVSEEVIDAQSSVCSSDSEGPQLEPLKVSASLTPGSRRLPRRVGLRCAPRSIVVWQMHGFHPGNSAGWETSLALRLGKASSAMLSTVFEHVSRTGGEIVRFDSLLCMASFRNLPAALTTAAQAAESAQVALAASATTRDIAIACSMAHGGCFVGVVGSAARRAMALNGAPVETAVRAVLWPASVGPRPVVRVTALVCSQLLLFQDGTKQSPWVFLHDLGVSVRRRPMPDDDCMFADAVLGDVTGCESTEPDEADDIVEQMRQLDRVACDSPTLSEGFEGAAVHALVTPSPVSRCRRSEQGTSQQSLSIE